MQIIDQDFFVVNENLPALVQALRKQGVAEEGDWYHWQIVDQAFIEDPNSWHGMDDQDNWIQLYTDLPYNKIIDLIYTIAPFVRPKSWILFKVGESWFKWVFDNQTVYEMEGVLTFPEDLE